MAGKSVELRGPLDYQDRFVTFPLVKMGRGEAFFGGLTYRRVSADHLEIYLALRQDGVVREERFEMARGN